jgi:ATPase subunit of ABC transporter with duplicated ATPase domains
LSQLLSRLESSNKDNHRQTRDTILECIKEEKQKSIEKCQRKKDGQAVKDTDAEAFEIISGIEMLNVSQSVEIKLRRAVHSEICQSLQYLEMTHRYEDVLEAYPETFEWAFHDPTEEQLLWSNLAYWLKQGDGIYWVNGKAGSGKSTFMKHLYDDTRTRRYLITWAGNV